MIGLYFSGTGNTRHCVERFLERTGAEAVSIEDPEAEARLRDHRDIVFGYPVQFSSLPKLVGDYIRGHGALWKGKRIFVIATMGLFSGDGAGVAARLFRAYGAEIVGGLHLRMPDSICDEKALKRPLEENRALVRRAEEKAEAAALALDRGDPPQEGLGPWPHLAGLLGQRLWFGHKTRRYSGGLKIDGEACIGCGYCTEQCPLGNLRLEGGKAAAGGVCTMCYRCVSLCPRKAITLLGRAVVEQSRVEKYL